MDGIGIGNDDMLLQQLRAAKEANRWQLSGDQPELEWLRIYESPEQPLTLPWTGGPGNFQVTVRQTMPTGGNAGLISF
jgi:hypothetical protein